MEKQDDNVRNLKLFWWRSLIALGFAGVVTAIPVVFGFIVYGRIGLEKQLTSLLMPCGLIWLLLLGLCCVAWAKRERFFLYGLIVVTVCYWCMGSGIGSGILRRSLENSVVIPDDDGEPFDFLLVLGGGTKLVRGDKVEVSGAGDRLVTAARMFNTGAAENLITTGGVVIQATDKDEQVLGASSMTKLLWMELGVPETAIRELDGRNTSEEMQSLREFLDTQPKDLKIGLVTSGYHMPRALRLARSQGFDFIPVMADQRPIRELYFRQWIPSGAAFHDSTLAAHEYLAWFFGR